MKKILFLFMPLLLFGIAAIAQVVDPLNDALTDVGLSPTAISIIGMAVLVVGKLIPQKWTDLMVYVEKLFLALYLGVKKLNDATNALSKAQKEEVLDKKLYDKEVAEVLNDARKKGLLRMVPIMLLLILMSFSASAQSPSFKGFWKPVSVNPAIQKMTDRAVDAATNEKDYVVLFRPVVDAVGSPVIFKKGGPEAKLLTGAGMGVSVSKYTTINEKPYCNFSVNLLALSTVYLNEILNTYWGGALLVGVFDNHINLGVGYLDKGVALMVGTKITF